MKKILVLVSVLILLLGIISLIVGGTNIAAISMLDNTIIANFLIGLTMVILIISGIFNTIAGILGIRAAKNPNKSTAALVLAILSLIISIIDILVQQNIESILGSIIPIIYFICILYIRKQAK